MSWSEITRSLAWASVRECHPRPSLQSLSAVSAEPLLVGVVTCLNRALRDRDAFRCETEEFENFARQSDLVGDEILEADSKWLDLVRCEPASPASVALHDLVCKRLDLFAVVNEHS
jgi:hypothetical protein